MQLIIQRIKRDFFTKSKIKDYERILKCAIKNNYEFHTVLSFEDIIKQGLISKESLNGKKYLINRRDVDTADYVVLHQFLNAEKKFGARCTYYFRLSTIDYDFMRNVCRCGGEASYHYEEIASYCYKYKIHNRNDVTSQFHLIRKQFVNNYTEVKRKSGLPCLTIASHGDFINVKLGMPNTLIIDGHVRAKIGISREAYDSEQMNYVTCRIADHSAKNFTDESIAAIERGEKVVYLLTHPRQWRSSPWINTQENIKRFIKGMYYKYQLHLTIIVMVTAVLESTRNAV